MPEQEAKYDVWQEFEREFSDGKSEKRYIQKIRFRNSFNNANASSCGEAFATFDLVVADVPLVLADVLALAPLRLLLLETYVQLPLELQPFIPVLSNPLPDQQQVQIVVEQFCDAWVGSSHQRLQQFAECDRDYLAVADRNSWLKTTEKTSALQLLFRAC